MGKDIEFCSHYHFMVISLAKAIPLTVSVIKKLLYNELAIATNDDLLPDFWHFNAICQIFGNFVHPPHCQPVCRSLDKD